MSLKIAQVITKEEANELEVDMKEGQIHVTSFRGLRVLDRHWPCHVVCQKKLPVMLRDVQAVSRTKEETLFVGG